MTHTPGPWEAHDDDGTGTLPCVLSDKVNAGGNFYVAQCNVYADARLIAAAPELLEAAKLALAENKRADLHFKNTSPATDALTAAIAKATG